MLHNRRTAIALRSAKSKLQRDISLATAISSLVVEFRSKIALIKKADTAVGVTIAMMVLEDAGHQLEAAVNGKKAVEKVYLSDTVRG